MKDDYYIIYEGDEDDIDHAFLAEDEETSAPSAEPDRVIASRERRRRALEARERRRLERLAKKEERQHVTSTRSKESMKGTDERTGVTKQAVTGTLTAGALLTVLGLILFAVFYPSAWYVTASAAKAAMTYVIYVAIGLGVLLLIAGDLLALNVRRAAD